MTSAAALPKWGGRRTQRLRLLVGQTLPAPCGKCGKTVRPDEPWVLGHKVSRGAAPELMYELGNLQPEHKRCSDASGTAGVREKALADARREAGLPSSRPVSSDGQGSRRSSPLPISLPNTPSDLRKRAHTHTGYAESDATVDPEKVRIAREDAMSAPWMADLRTLPADATWPTAMTGRHPEAVGSYGRHLEQWAREELGIELRWWQRLAMRRQLEFDVGGRLVWPQILESTPRRAGKSWRLFTLAAWRIEHAAMFGEEQLVMHVARDLSVAREILRLGWTWAERKGYKLYKANGKESVEIPASNARWLVRTPAGTTGYGSTLALGDEAWDLDAGVINENLEPTLLGKRSAQLLLTSTAHRKATQLMVKRFRSALASVDSSSSTLLLWWGGSRDDDISDPSAWRAASPHWDEARETFLRARLERLLSGEMEADEDDPDPIEGFRTQYLNVWPDKDSLIRHPGEPLVGRDLWDAAELEVDGSSRPDAAAVEAWFGAGMTVCLARKLDGGRVVVSSLPASTAEEAAAILKTSGAPILVAGKSLTAEPALAALGVQAATGTSRAAAVEFRRLVDSNVLAHDGSLGLTEQVVGVNVLAGSDGPRLPSGTRADGIKAAVWAVQHARTGGERPRVF